MQQCVIFAQRYTCSLAQLRTLWHSFEEERLLLCPSRVLFHELRGIVAFMQTCSLMLDTCTVHFALYFNIWVRTCSNFISTAISKLISVPVSVICDYLCYYHCVKVVCIRSFSGVYFPVFGLNTEIYPVNLCIQCECGKKNGPEKLRIWKLFTQCKPQGNYWVSRKMLNVSQFI